MGKDNAVGLSKDNRTRNWLFVVYPESAPVDWEEKLNEYHIPWGHSPLHDRDINYESRNEEGEYEFKKEHWHCIFCFDSLKTQKQVFDILKEVLGCGAKLPIPCHSARGAVRYFTHMDNPEKAQYDPRLSYWHIIDYESLVVPTTSEKDFIIKEMCEYCLQNNIIELCDLTEYALKEQPDWFHILANCSTLFMTNYIRSLRHKSTRPLI